MIGSKKGLKSMGDIDKYEDAFGRGYDLGITIANEVKIKYRDIIDRESEAFDNGLTKAFAATYYGD